MSSVLPTPARLSLRDICIVSAVYLASFLIVSGFPHVLIAFPLDDSWIHQVVARNFARYGTLGFIPGVWSSGSSSLLWTLVLAINWKFLPAINPVLYSDALNIVFLVAIGIAMLAMARKDGLPNSSCWIWALAPAFNGNFVWLGLLGMEHVLFVMLSVVGIYLWFESGLRSAVLCALCLGALTITRPEGVVLAFLAVLGAPLARRGRRDILILISAVTVCVAASLAANLRTSQSWLPMTYEGRKWLYFGSVHVPLKARFLFLLQLFATILRPWSARTPVVLFLQAFAVLLIAAGIRRLYRERRLRAGFLCVWSFVLIGTYFLMLPAPSHAGRYQPLFLALNLPIMFLGFESSLHFVSQRFRAPRRRVIVHRATLLALCLVSSVASLVLWRQVARDSTTVIESTHATMAEYIVGHIPPPTKVAAFDIGRIGYLYGGKLIDLGGLTNSAFLPYMRQHRVMDYLDARDISYFVWPSQPDGDSTIPNALIITPQIRRRLVTVATFCAPKAAWEINSEAIGNITRCQVLYRVKGDNSAPSGDGAVLPVHLSTHK